MTQPDTPSSDAPAAKPVEPPPYAHAPTPPPTHPGIPADFKPLCPDCRYDLTGLGDGRCPECGGWFTHARVRQLYLAQQAAKAERGKKALVTAGVIALVSIPLLCALNSPVGIAGALAFWTLGAAAWFWFNRTTWIAHAYVLLVLVVPLVLMMLSLAATPYGRWICLVLAAVVFAVCFLAMRWSPLVSGVLVFLFGIIPIVMLALFMYAHASVRVAGGHYWSDFDQPTPTGWRALPAGETVLVAKLMAGFGAALCMVMLVFARRGWVRFMKAGAVLSGG